MTGKKLSVYIKTQPSSMGYLHKFDVDCDYCAYCIKEDYPFCFHGTGCAIAERIAKQLGKESISFDTTNTNNPNVSVVARNIDGLGKVYEVAVEAIEFCAGTHNVKVK